MTREVLASSCEGKATNTVMPSHEVRHKPCFKLQIFILFIFIIFIFILMCNLENQIKHLAEITFPTRFYQCCQCFNAQTAEFTACG